jgi:carboxypeptidase family protein
MFSNRSANLVAFLLFCVSTFCRLCACECGPTPPPCAAVGYADLVFLGTVIEISARVDHLTTARMHVDRAFKGILHETIELYDDGMCDGPALQFGHQYLMYTRGSSTEPVPARGCSRSRAIEDADEDLEFLNQYRLGKVAPHISGTVRLVPDNDDWLDDDDLTPLKGVRITASSSGRKFHGVTDSLGGYSISGVLPGQYSIEASLPGYLTSWAPEDITVHPKGCAQADLQMTVDRQVRGFVRSENGGPAPGVLVEMRLTNRTAGDPRAPVLLSISDERGYYQIRAIPPGNYYLGVNASSTPKKEQPYTPTYYPNTTDIKQATIVGVVPGVSVQNLDLRVPVRLPLVRIRGRVLNSDGNPPNPEDHPQVRIKEPGLYGQIEEKSIEIDAEGRFEFELCEGVRYSAFAFAGPGATKTYSAPVEFAPSKDQNVLTLVLDKTLEEFRKLRPR